MQVLPNHLRPRREKLFGDGPRVPLDREAKVRITRLAEALSKRTERGRHYGLLTGKFVRVLRALLWLIHDGRSGQCNPAYETIAAKADCARSTVYEAIRALEAAGILSWVNRLTRVRERDVDLFGRTIWVWRVVRTSNAYTFRDPKASEAHGKASKSDFPPGPLDGIKKQPAPPVDNRPTDPDLARALAAYRHSAGFIA
jgi:helix-turn-helix protein